jgi:GT2 family glycosyltransferase
MPDVSIVIVNWNTKDLLRNCLMSIDEQADDTDYQVIVIDNASTDGSTNMINCEFTQVTVLANTKNLGFAAANNQGIKKTSSRYILLLNSDTVILDNAIAKTVVFADAHPNAAVIGCRVLNSDKTLQPTCFMFPSLLNMLLSTTYLYKLFPRNKFFGRERMSWWDRDDARQVDVVTGCFMLVRREAIEQIGLLDDSFFMYGEETDWCYRFKKGGWKIMFTPQAEITHLGRASSKKNAFQMSLQLRGSILQFVHKHHSWLYYVLSCILVWIFFAIRIQAWSIKYLINRSDDCKEQLKIYKAGMWRLLSHGYKGLLYCP